MNQPAPPTERSRPGRMLARSLIIISLGLMAGAADSWIRPVKLSATDPSQHPSASTLEPSTAPNPAAPTTGPDGKTITPPPVTPVTPAAETLGLRITLAQARKLFEGGTPFLDGRTEEEFRAGHIAGAFHLPADAFSKPGGVDALSYLDQRAPVVIYCGGGECHASEYVAIELEKAGFKSYHIMSDGFPAWQAAGYDVATGDK